MSSDREHNLSKATDFIWPAYELSQQRLDSINRRLEGLMATAVGLIPVAVAASENRSMFSLWFLFACLWAAASLGNALYGRQTAVVIVTDLRIVADYAKKVDSAKFSGWAVEWAGEHIAQIGSTLRRQPNTRSRCSCVGLLV